MCAANKQSTSPFVCLLFRWWFRVCPMRGKKMWRRRRHLRKTVPWLLGVRSVLFGLRSWSLHVYLYQFWAAMPSDHMCVRLILDQQRLLRHNFNYQQMYQKIYWIRFGTWHLLVTYTTDVWAEPLSVSIIRCPFDLLPFFHHDGSSCFSWQSTPTYEIICLEIRPFNSNIDNTHSRNARFARNRGKTFCWPNTARMQSRLESVCVRVRLWVWENGKLPLFHMLECRALAARRARIRLN